MRPQNKALLEKWMKGNQKILKLAQRIHPRLEIALHGDTKNILFDDVPPKQRDEALKFVLKKTEEIEKISRSLLKAFDKTLE